MHETEAKLRALEKRLEDLKARLPKHSLPVSMAVEVEELEEEIARLQRQIMEQGPPTIRA